MSRRNEVESGNLFGISRRVFHPTMPKAIRAEAILVFTQAAIAAAGVGEWHIKKTRSLYIPIVGESSVKYALESTSRPWAIDSQSMLAEVQKAPTATEPAALTVRSAIIRRGSGSVTQLNIAFEEDNPDLAGIREEQERGITELEGQSDVSLRHPRPHLQLAYSVDTIVKQANLEAFRQGMTVGMAALIGPVVFQPPDIYR